MANGYILIREYDFEKQDAVDEKIWLDNRMFQRVIVIIPVDINILVECLKVAIELNALTWVASQVTLANHQINGRLNVFHLTYWTLLKHRLKFIRSW